MRPRRCMRRMRRLVLLLGCSIAVAAVAVTLAAGWNQWRSLLPLHAPTRATPSLTAVLSDDSGSRLAQIEPATFARLRASARMTYYEGWVRSPDGRLLAVSTNPDSNDVSYSTLHFATVSSLRWQPPGVRLNGYFDAAIWPRPIALYALVGDYSGPGLTLDKIDVAARKIVAQTRLPGPVLDIQRSAKGLVVLEGGKNNAISPARLLILDADGAVRSLRLARILAGTHFDQSAQDPIGTIREPGLAVDPSHAVAYVLDPDGLVAAIGLRDLAVTYHRLGHKSLVARLSNWLTPAALAKGANGPMLTAQWLGDGLIALTGNNEHKDGSLDFSIQPAGLAPRRHPTLARPHTRPASRQPARRQRSDARQRRQLALQQQRLDQLGRGHRRVQPERIAPLAARSRKERPAGRRVREPSARPVRHHIRPGTAPARQPRNRTGRPPAPQQQLRHAPPRQRLPPTVSQSSQAARVNPVRTWLSPATVRGVCVAVPRLFSSPWRHCWQ